MTPLERAARALSSEMKQVSENLVTGDDGHPKRTGVWSAAVASDKIAGWAAMIDAALEEG